MSQAILDALSTVAGINEQPGEAGKETASICPGWKQSPPHEITEIYIYIYALLPRWPSFRHLYNLICHRVIVAQTWELKRIFSGTEAPANIPGASFWRWVLLKPTETAVHDGLINMTWYISNHFLNFMWLPGNPIIFEVCLHALKFSLLGGHKTIKRKQRSYRRWNCNCAWTMFAKCSVPWIFDLGDWNGRCCFLRRVSLALIQKFRRSVDVTD